MPIHLQVLPTEFGRETCVFFVAEVHITAVLIHVVLKSATLLALGDVWAVRSVRSVLINGPYSEALLRTIPKLPAFLEMGKLSSTVDLFPPIFGAVPGIYIPENAGVNFFDIFSG